MSNIYKDPDPGETQEWIDSIEDALEEHGYERTRHLLETLIDFAQSKGARLPFNTGTPFVNTILPGQQPEYPGDRKIERKIKSIVRWNAMAMVTKANKETPGIGGHISTYASAATLYEVAFNHVFKGANHPSGSDLIFSFTASLSSSLFNLILIEPGKSFVRVIQSIGRGIRKAKDKDFVQIWDLTSSCKFAKRHLTHRKKFYKEANYPFTIEKVDWTK